MGFYRIIKMKKAKPQQYRTINGTLINAYPTVSTSNAIKRHHSTILTAPKLFVTVGTAGSSAYKAPTA
jgi:hypothetical protein